MNPPTSPRDAELPLFPRQRREIAPDAWLLPGWLDVPRQRRLVDAARIWCRPPAPMRKIRLPNGGVMSVAVACLGWYWVPYRYVTHAIDTDGAAVTAMPSWLAAWGRDAVCEAYGPTAYEPDAALVNFYDPTAKLGMHQDKDETAPDPVVSFSVGDTGIFRIGTPQARGRPYVDVELHSGDAVVFGGASRLAFHGVPRIVPATAPPSLDMAPGRLNITLRVTGLSPPTAAQ